MGSLEEFRVLEPKPINRRNTTMSEDHKPPSGAGLGISLGAEGYTPPVETMTFDDHKRRLLVGQLRICAGLLADQQRSICQRIAGLLDVDYHRVFDDLMLENIETRLERPESVPSEFLRITSDPLEFDADSVLIEDNFARLCESVRSKYKQVADGLWQRVKQHEDAGKRRCSLCLGYPQAYVVSSGFSLSIKISSMTAVF